MFFLIPYADQNPTKKIPFITAMLIIINCGVYVYQYWMTPSIYESAMPMALGLIPYEITHFRDIGVIKAPYTPYANLLFYMFLHGGFWHLAGNMLFLWIYGDNVEDKLGHFRFLFFYLACGIAAGLVQIFFGPFVKIPTIGASGAIAGVMGAYLRFFPKAKVKCLFIFIIFPEIILLPAVLILGIWILLQFANAFFLIGENSEGVAWFAHIGGFITGFYYAIKRQKVRIFR